MFQHHINKFVARLEKKSFSICRLTRIMCYGWVAIETHTHRSTVVIAAFYIRLIASVDINLFNMLLASNNKFGANITNSALYIIFSF